ncbi:hypothetical protein ACFFX0_28565 [Citricoccus parietis]|uniref:Uncharacterized protein n=1 Tax=Citricoccus parietis TaxID=592307 RepID=A0ABV5FSP2_9MICC
MSGTGSVFTSSPGSGWSCSGGEIFGCRVVGSSAASWPAPAPPPLALRSAWFSGWFADPFMTPTLRTCPSGIKSSPAHHPYAARELPGRAAGCDSMAA